MQVVWDVWVKFFCNVSAARKNPGVFSVGCIKKFFMDDGCTREGFSALTGVQEIGNKQEKSKVIAVHVLILYILRFGYQHRANICVRLCKCGVLWFCVDFRFSVLILWFAYRCAQFVSFLRWGNIRTRWISKALFRALIDRQEIEVARCVGSSFS